jgi:hypothetical protein
VITSRARPERLELESSPDIWHFHGVFGKSARRRIARRNAVSSAIPSDGYRSEG